MEFIGNVNVLSTSKGGTDILVAGGHIFGYCLSEADIKALKMLGGEVKTFKRADGTEGKCLPCGTVKVELTQVDEMETLDAEGRTVVVPIYKFATVPVRAEDASAKAFFG